MISLEADFVINFFFITSGTSAATMHFANERSTGSM